MENPYQAPEANLSDKNSDADILNALPRFSAWWVFLIGIITQWIYSAFWLYNRTKVLNEISDTQPISKGFVNTTIACYVVTITLDIYTRVMGENEPVMAVLLASLTLYLISAVLIIIWCFKVKRLIESLPVNTIDNRLSGLLTFFFHVIYLQYKINELIDCSARQKGTI